MSVLYKSQQIRTSWKGELCVLREDHEDAGEFAFDHVDESGHSCKCDLCSRGKILHQACLCDPNSSGYLQPSDCRFVNPGEQMMPDRNNCTKGFDCQKCNHPRTVKAQCGVDGPDTECKCADGYYQASEEECKLYPRCDEGFEPAPGYGDDFSEIRCKQCRPGYYQPTNNSTDKCRPHTNCTTWAGTIQADAQCLNGPPTGGDPSGESKPSNVLNGTNVTANTTGPTMPPMWTPDLWSVLIGFVSGALVACAIYAIYHVYQCIKHPARLRDLRDAVNQICPANDADLRDAVNQICPANDAGEASERVSIEDENENEAPDVTLRDETADQNSIDDNSNVPLMESYHQSAGKAGQIELKHRFPNTSSSSSSEDQRQDSEFIQYPANQMLVKTATGSS